MKDQAQNNPKSDQRWMTVGNKIGKAISARGVRLKRSQKIEKIGQSDRSQLDKTTIVAALSGHSLRQK